MPSPLRRSPLRAVAALTVLVVALTIGLSLSAEAGVGAAPPPSTAAADGQGPAPGSSCRRPAPTTAAGYSRAFALQPDGWAGADQTSSTRLPDGRTLWVFNDTVRTDGTMVHDSFVVQDAGCFHVVGGRAAPELLPAPVPGTWYWPLNAVVDGPRLWVPALRVTSAANGVGFAILGVDLAELELRAGQDPRFVRTYRTPASAAGPRGVWWGAGLVRDGSMLYVYGTRTSDGFGKELRLARVPLSRVTDPAAWEYRASDGWSPRAADASVLRPAVGGASTAFSVQRTGGSWVIVTKKDGFLGTQVVRLAAAHPWGPFRERSLFASPSTPTALTYIAMAHPEADLAGGALLVSVNRNNPDLRAVLRDPAQYRARFVAVPRSRLS